MTDGGRQLPVLTRQAIIVSIMAVNEKQLRLDNAHYGRDIERACVLRDIETLGASAGLSEQLKVLDAEIDRLTVERQKLTKEREWLEQSLAGFQGDAAPARKQ